ncbi:hypothetical protein [Pseudooceanicola nanhaiensis]|uniref:hypothetical protein n=1 Tax=Pseudooceanicola nanhaiensis TaxID=375761 RepID=UPI003511DC5C
MIRLYAPLLALCIAPPLGAEPVIALNGEAEFGVTYGAAGSDVHTRYTLDLSPRIRTDGGLTIGAQTRLRADPGRPAQIAAPRYYITTGRPQALPRR